MILFFFVERRRELRFTGHGRVYAQKLVRPELPSVLGVLTGGVVDCEAWREKLCLSRAPKAGVPESWTVVALRESASPGASLNRSLTFLSIRFGERGVVKIMTYKRARPVPCFVAETGEVVQFFTTGIHIAMR